MLIILEIKTTWKERFKLFKPIYIDSYDMQFRHEGSEKRYTFCGIKNKLNFSEVLEKLAL